MFDTIPAPAFTVHVKGHGSGLRVYVMREWSQGVDPAHHYCETFRAGEDDKAHLYALTLSETHGDCAVLLH